jgi:hypothetical protein
MLRALMKKKKNELVLYWWQEQENFPCSKTYRPALEPMYSALGLKWLGLKADH